MIRMLSTIALATALVAGAGSTASADTGRAVVYVVSQGLCYDSVVAPNELPPQGPFQLLTPSTICGPGTLMTDVGPGDPGYAGGRWITLDGKRFSCPLIGPGYPPPQ
jgi:hypothetical protein